MNLILVLVIALSLSMDAFSLSLAYGTLSLTKKEINTISVTVGIYHFLMPILGNIIGLQVMNFLPVSSNIIVFIVLLIIGIEMIVETFKAAENVKRMKLVEIILFGFAVSLDAFSVGIGLKSLTDNFLIASFLFSITSLVFTFVGLLLGNKINKRIGSLSTLLGGITLIIIAVTYLV